MKELSIEEKAKAYDEVIEKLREFYRDYDTVSHLIDVKEELANRFPELKESEDERIRKELLSFFNERAFYTEDSTFNGLSSREIISWLEKQCQTFTKKDVDNAYLKGICDAKHELEKQGLEYKDGKIVKKEPKFKKGDWVVYCNEDVDLITGIEEDGYTINEGGYIPFACEDSMQLWDISLARDGDVLADNVGIILFRRIGNGRYVDAVDYYCVVFTRGEFKIQKGLSYWGLSTDAQLRPATEEQRKGFFAAMHDAGYEWDADNKQLKKIEPKEEPTEFERGYKQAIEDAVRYMDKVWGLNIFGNSINDFRETMEQKLKKLSQG